MNTLLPLPLLSLISIFTQILLILLYSKKCLYRSREVGTVGPYFEHSCLFFEEAIRTSGVFIAVCPADHCFHNKKKMQMFSACLVQKQWWNLLMETLILTAVRSCHFAVCFYFFSLPAVCLVKKMMQNLLNGTVMKT